MNQLADTAHEHPDSRHESADAQPQRADVVILGAGSAATALAGELAGGAVDVTVVESDRVGGECPFVACMPSKTMLHDAEASVAWASAVDRRDDAVDHLDDSEHARALADSGATLIRGRARIVDEHTVEAGGRQLHAEHIVVATGCEPVIPDIDGIDTLGEHLWTSDEALTTTERPMRLLVIGGGAIGCELATLFAGFDTEVHLTDVDDRAFPSLPHQIGDIVDNRLGTLGVRVCRGRRAVRFELRGNNVLAELDNGATVITDRVVVAAGRRPRLHDIGLERLELDPDAALAVDGRGRVESPGSVWAIGDVAGRGQYTHVANHHAAVVADQLIGDGTRRFEEVVTPACIFTRPPVMTIGPVPADVDDAVWVEARLSEVPRWTTDDLGDGYITAAVDRHTRCVVAAHGVGARFDELAAALVTAIDAAVPVDRLAMSMWPFPTVGELLGLLYDRAITALDA